MEHTEQSLSTRDLAAADRAADARSEPDEQARDVAPESEPPSTPSPEPDAGAANGGEPLLSTEVSAEYQGRWEQIQTRFVDEPRGSVEDADRLVANVMQELAEGFAQERERLEGQWDRGEDISTEDLRVALRRYRSFFQRLLSA